MPSPWSSPPPPPTVTAAALLAGFRLHAADPRRRRPDLLIWPVVLVSTAAATLVGTTTEAPQLTTRRAVPSHRLHRSSPPLQCRQYLSPDPSPSTTGPVHRRPPSTSLLCLKPPPVHNCRPSHTGALPPFSLTPSEPPLIEPPALTPSPRLPLLLPLRVYRPPSTPPGPAASHPHPHARALFHRRNRVCFRRRKPTLSWF